jgi:beta-N-acetylhexosaminidase
VVIGTTWAGAEQADLVRRVLAVGTPVVTVALRTPFDLAAYPEAPAHLCTYSIHPPSMEALADVVFGMAPTTGRLPAAIPGLYPRGHGAGD